MKIGRLVIERKSDEELRREKQELINTIRRGGGGKMADREQRKLDKQ